MVAQSGPDFSRLIAFADRVRALDQSAWGRIQARCVTLDVQSPGARRVDRTRHDPAHGSLH